MLLCIVTKSSRQLTIRRADDGGVVAAQRHAVLALERRDAVARRPAAAVESTLPHHRICVLVALRRGARLQDNMPIRSTRSRSVLVAQRWQQPCTCSLTPPPLRIHCCSVCHDCKHRWHTSRNCQQLPHKVPSCTAFGAAALWAIAAPTYHATHCGSRLGLITVL